MMYEIELQIDDDIICCSFDTFEEAVAYSQKYSECAELVLFIDPDGNPVTFPA